MDSNSGGEANVGTFLSSPPHFKGGIMDIIEQEIIKLVADSAIDSADFRAAQVAARELEAIIDAEILQGENNG